MTSRNRTVKVTIVGDAKSLNRAFGKAGKGAGKFKQALGKLQKAALVGVTAIATGSVLAFASFDEAMTKSLAIMGDVSDAMRDDMSKAAREVAKTTTFSAKQAAESFFFLASAGLDAKESIAALPKVAAFAQAGNFDMALATDLLTDAQSALGLTSDNAAESLREMARVGDVLVKANTLANASVQQFSESLTNKAGAALKIVNKDLEEGVAVLAVYADQGVKGAEAGTALAIVLRDLQTKAIKNTELFDEMNIAVFNNEGNMNNLADIVGDLEGALEGMSDEQAKATLLQLGFGDKSVQFIQALLGSSDAIRTYEADLRSAGGIVDEVAQKQLKSATAKFQLFKSQIIDVGIALGQKLMPFLLDLKDGVVELARKFTELSPTVKKIIIVVGLLAVALLALSANPILIGLGLLATAIALIGRNARVERDAIADFKTELEELGEISLESLTEGITEGQLESLKKFGFSVRDVQAAINEGTTGELIDEIFELARADFQLEGASRRAAAGVQILARRVGAASEEIDEETRAANLAAIAMVTLDKETVNLGGGFVFVKKRAREVATVLKKETAEAAEEAAKAFAIWRDKVVEAARESERATRESITSIINLFEGAPEQIEISVDEMVANIRAQRELAVEFELVMRELGKAGLDSLVEEFRTAGPQATKAALALVDDMASAMEIEAELRFLKFGDIAGVTAAERMGEAFESSLNLLNAAAIEQKRMEQFFDQNPVRVRLEVPKIGFRTRDGSINPTRLGSTSFAHGGVARKRRGGLDATLGEGGVDEAVIPLNEQGISVIAAAMSKALGQGAGGGIGAPQQQPLIIQLVVEGKVLAEVIRDFETGLG